MKKTPFILFAAFFSFALYAQEPNIWTLRNAIDYALKNNIKVQKSAIDIKNAEEDYAQSKASAFPTLTFGASESYSHGMKSGGDGYEGYHSFGENYRLSGDVTIFNGLKIKNNIQQKALMLDINGFALEEVKQNIEIAITEAYLQILYAKESVHTAESALNTSIAQAEQAEKKYKVGAISESDHAKIQSEKSNYEYQLVSAENSLSTKILEFKQLLELGIDDVVDLYFPEIDDNDVIALVPSKEEVFNTAMSFLPQVKASEYRIKSAEYDLKQAKADLYPSLSLNAGLSTGATHPVPGKDYNTEKYGTQLYHNFAHNIGLSLNYRIFNHREVRTRINKSENAIETAQLNAKQTEKDVLKKVEDIYLQVVSAQKRFVYSKEALRSAEITYKLMENKFNLGMKDIYEYTIERNNYLNAQLRFLQAKYETIFYQKILDFYQHKQINL